MVKGTRDKMIDATVESLRRHGVAGTSFTEVITRSGAARGAIYHHFPGGKAELTEAAVRAHGGDVAAWLQTVHGATPHEVVTSFFELVRPVVAQSSTGSGCAVGAAALETAPATALQLAVGEVFAAWTEPLAQALSAAGMREPAATELATLLIVTLQGAHVVCRAEASLAPFEAAATTLSALVAVGAA